MKYFQNSIKSTSFTDKKTEQTDNKQVLPKRCRVPNKTHVICSHRAIVSVLQ